MLTQALQSRLDNSNLDPKEVKRAKEGQVSTEGKEGRELGKEARMPWRDRGWEEWMEGKE